MLDRLGVTGINHLLRAASWARDSLGPHAGKTARFECTPFTVQFTVLPGGEVAAAPPGTPADVTINLSPGLLPRALMRDPALWNEIGVTGDTAFASAIDHLWRNLEWDVEEDLSRVFGDIAARRMTQTARGVQDWGRNSASSVAGALADYWTEEQPLITKARHIEQFSRDVDALRDDVARLEKRLAQLLTTPPPV